MYPQSGKQSYLSVCSVRNVVYVLLTSPEDEADVFLERRSVHDLSRNALVAVFLRKLECVSSTHMTKLC